MLFVSHDRYFVKQVATGILEFGQIYVKQYDCGYEEYLQEKVKLGEQGRAVAQGKVTAATGFSTAVTRAGKAASQAPTLQDVFDKKTYYNRDVFHPVSVACHIRNMLEFRLKYL